MLSLKYIIKNKKQTITLISALTLSSIILFSIGILFSSFRSYLITKTIYEKGNYHVKIVGNIQKNSDIFKMWKKNRINYIKYNNINDTYKNTKNICQNQNCLKITYNSELLALYGISNNKIMKIFKNIIFTFSTIFGISSLFIIYTSFQISLVKKKRDIALLKLSGLTNKDIYIIFFLENIISSTIGIILGFLLSIALNLLTINCINHLLKEALISKIYLNIYPSFIKIPLIFIIFIAYISSTIPLLKIKKYSVMDLFKQNDISNYEIKTHFKSFIINYSYINYKRAKKKYKSLIICVFTSCLLFCTFTSIMNYTHKILDKYINLPNYDISITTTQKDYKKLKKLSKQLKPIKKTIFKSCTTNTIIKNDNEITVLVTNLGKNEIINQVNEVISKDNKMIKKQYKPYKNVKELTIENITISNLKLTNKIPFGFENNLTSEFMLLNLNNKNFNKICSSYQGQAYIKTPQNNLDKFMNQYIKKNNFSEVTYTNIKKAISLTNNFLLLIKTFLLSCLLMITLILVISIINITSASINIRKKEFSILKSIGFTTNNIIKCLFLESLIITIKGFLYALPFVLLISKNLYISLSNMFNINLTLFNFKVFIIYFIFILLLIFTSMVLIHKQIYKKGIINNLKSENF